MAEDLIQIQGTKAEKYQSLLPQIAALVGDERDSTANLANIAAALKQNFNFFWVGFYLLKHNELVLGPFQGPVACTRIQYGKGVCGKAWENKEILIVPNVEEFPGHIACSDLSKSEIVIPMIHKNGTFTGVLDVDSNQLNDFDDVDANYLNQLCQWFVAL